MSASRFLACLLGLLFAVQVQAQNPDSAVHPGHTVCSRLVASHNPAQMASTLDFISGYGTARYALGTRRGVAETDPFFSLPPKAVAKWLLDWCADNPRRSMADAASHFYDQLPGAGPLAAPFSLGVSGAPAAPPSSCSAPAAGACAGCSASCAAPTQALCSVGRELSRGAPFGARCGAASQCECR